MIRCPACGEENPERFRLCGYCGHLLSTPDSTQVRKTVTVLFSDICGSTSLGERLDPETLRQGMSRYFSTARMVIERHGGTVEKFVGDAVMAVFGVPVAHEDDALRAVSAAVGIRDALAVLDREFEEAWGVRLEARTGVNSGEVITGDPASGQSFVSGDAVNVAARLEQAAEPGEILIGAETLQLVRDAVWVDRMERLSLKGKTEAIAAFRLLRVVAGAAPFKRRLDSPMVGRDAELRQLHDAFERAVRGPRCELVTVLGAAGVGKSRLALEMLSGLPVGTRVIEGRCLPYGEGITFWPVSEMVKQAAGIEDGDAPAAARDKILRLLEREADEASLIGARVAAAIGLGDAQGALQETFWAIRRFLESLAARQPVVAVFDDIQWAESTMLDLIEYLARFSRAHPILLLCVARPEILENRPDWGRIGTVIPLGPLDSDDSARLVQNLVGQARLPAEIRDPILDTAEGNPLFVEEMLRMLIDQGALEQQDGRWVLVGDLSLVSAPRTIQAIIAARLDRLHDEERAVVQRAAVVGRVFYWGAIDALSPGEAGRRIGGHLQALLSKELILPEPSPFAGQDAFRFSHILVRDAAYDSIPKRTQVDLHERLAGWLEQVAGDRLPEYEEVIGYHLEQAHRYLAEVRPLDDRVSLLARRASERLAEAGRRSYGRGDMRAAVSLLSRAAALRAPADPARLDLLPLLGSALAETGRLAEAGIVLAEAIERARTAGDRRLEARAFSRWVFVSSLRDPEASTRKALDQAEASIALFEEDDDLDLSEGWKLVGSLRLWLGQAAAGEEALERASNYARRAGDHRQGLEILRWVAWCLLAGPRPVPSALDQLADIEARFGPTDRTAKFYVAGIRSELEGMQGGFDVAREAVGTAKWLAEELGLDVDYAAGVLHHSGYVEYLAGDLDKAEQELREACRLLEQLGDKGHLASLAPFLADILYAQGREDEALSLTEVGRSAAIEDDVEAQVEWRRVRAKILARQGDAVQAQRLAREAVELACQTDYLDLHALALLDQAEVIRLARRDADAVAIVRQAQHLFEQKGNVVMARRANALLEELAAGRPCHGEGAG
jgi:class 3 adenylate cyclase/tetratricopeptide (TPR) repeat protein